MHENLNQILAEAQSYVKEIFQKKVNPLFIFHNIEHTQQVVTAVEEIGSQYQLNEHDFFILKIAAMFHDTGFSSGRPEDHEKESIRIATEFLQQHHVDGDMIQRVSSCIQATRMPQSPLSQIEKILCDADLFHLGGNDFKAWTQRLKQEQEAFFRKEVSKKDWRQRNLEFLESHQYFTDYAQKKQEPKKQEWLKQLRKKLGGKEIKHTEETEISPYAFTKEDDTNKGDNKNKGTAKNADKEAERSIQTLFRTTSNNHFSLSAMADSKANIMISVNSIIISILFSVILGRLEYYPHLIYPTLILSTVCLLAIIFSVLATRPSVSGGRFTEDDIRNKKTNLLFFGNFHRMNLDEYHWAMGELLKDRDYIYDSMVKDIYFLGVVLARKYRFLRISYTIFMYGLIASVIAFGLSSFLGGQ